MTVLAASAALMLFVPQAQDHAAHVAHFLAALPDQDKAGDDEGERAEAAQQTTSLIAANPGKESAIRAAVGDRSKCRSDLAAASTKAVLHQAAATLSDDELDRMAAFYASPDLAALDHADAAKIKEIGQRYPLQRFYDAMQKSMSDNMETTIAGLDACEAAMQAGLAKAGVTAEAPKE